LVVVPVNLSISSFKLRILDKLRFKILSPLPL